MQALVLSAILLSGCATTIRSTAPGPVTPNAMTEFWEEPRNLATKDLYWGPWGQRLAPRPGQIFTFVEEKTSGFSPGYTVKDERGREWSVKQGPEAGVEVVVSRLLSAIGYHQPPVYYLSSWTKNGGPGEAQQGPGRFRPKDIGLDEEGAWSWQENPFVGTRPYGGLLAFMMLVNGTDLKNDNNSLYDVDRAVRTSAATRWYVVRDVGAALGETGILEPRRGDPFTFEKIDFIRGVEGQRVLFNYNGRHKELIDQLEVRDVKWMAALVSRLSDRQWREAFRAGGYGPQASAMFIRKIKSKLAEARRVQPVVTRASR